MCEDPFVSRLGMLLIAAAVFGFLARLVKMPAVVGYLVAGLVLGPLTGMVEVGESLAHVSEAASHCCSSSSGWS
jgi:Kef-type K+ transport system membrane component KefB